MRKILKVLALAAAWPGAGQTPDIRVDVNLVTVACSVTANGGSPARDLLREDFTLTDNGNPVDIQYFWQETGLPLTLGLLIDVSGSQVGMMGKHRETMNRFINQVIGSQDRAFVVTIASEVKLLQDLTGSTSELHAALNRIQLRKNTGEQFGEPCRGKDAPRRGRRLVHGCGGTALWNGVYAAAKLKMKPLSGRKALIVLSDGMDTGSFHSLTDAIEAAQSADTLVYTIRYISPMVKFTAPGLIRTTFWKPMNRLSTETGAKAYSAPGDPSEVFTEIENELRNLYVLGFTPPESSRDGKFHKLEIKARGGAKVRARSGYTSAL